jgi:hypothetical protein
MFSITKYHCTTLREISREKYSETTTQLLLLIESKICRLIYWHSGLIRFISFLLCLLLIILEATISCFLFLNLRSNAELKLTSNLLLILAESSVVGTGPPKKFETKLYPSIVTFFRSLSRLQSMYEAPKLAILNVVAQEWQSQAWVERLKHARYAQPKAFLSRGTRH